MGYGHGHPKALCGEAVTLKTLLCVVKLLALQDPYKSCEPSDHSLHDDEEQQSAYYERGYGTRNGFRLPSVVRNHEIRDAESGRVVS
jgi:hypothetical protein